MTALHETETLALPFLDVTLPDNKIFSKIEQASNIAKANFLVSFESDLIIIKERDIPFLARLAKNLSQKGEKLSQAKVDTNNPATSKSVQEAPKSSDPFMPPFAHGSHVCDLNRTHRLLLNKFNVVSNHIVVVTQKYESQHDPLTLADAQVMLDLLRSADYLLFFNGGVNSGASQPHKHIQGIPRGISSHELPIDLCLFDSKGKHSHPNKIQVNFFAELYPFIHCSYFFGKNALDNVSGKSLLELYLQMIEQTKLTIKQSNDVSVQKVIAIGETHHHLSLGKKKTTKHTYMHIYIYIHT
ncbi:ATP adenylyltransferase-like protein [Reticulomyxa filosa]|uniref:ATP adenylyltransferase-like protein n=1 Tax=Reticulomyxa filosa TaxID=46433 RepID=X6LZD9_RETFI|nr:ATP adenylyltransferase-like protein [Reticulomyxa filosa]|eukprot:ETO06726.1 ATP adenylyltransferase-like protein [Reticulomyxa filosa]